MNISTFLSTFEALLTASLRLGPSQMQIVAVNTKRMHSQLKLMACACPGKSTDVPPIPWKSRARPQTEVVKGPENEDEKTKLK